MSEIHPRGCVVYEAISRRSFRPHHFGSVLPLCYEDNSLGNSRGVLFMKRYRRDLSDPTILVVCCPSVTKIIV